MWHSHNSERITAVNNGMTSQLSSLRDHHRYFYTLCCFCFRQCFLKYEDASTHLVTVTWQKPHNPWGFSKFHVRLWKFGLFTHSVLCERKQEWTVAKTANNITHWLLVLLLLSYWFVFIPTYLCPSYWVYLFPLCLAHPSVSLSPWLIFLYIHVSLFSYRSYFLFYFDSYLSLVLSFPSPSHIGKWTVSNLSERSKRFT